MDNLNTKTEISTPKQEDPQILRANEAQREYFLETIPLIRSIAAHKIGRKYTSAVEDLVQKTALKLWSWQSKKEDLSLTREEWRRLANTAAQNEVKTFYKQKFHKEVPIPDHEGGQVFADKSGESRIEGNTGAESNSLMTFLWKAMQELSLRQRFALLLWDKAFIVNLIVGGCCTIGELATFFKLEEKSLRKLIKILPLSDSDLSELLKREFELEVTERQIWNARGKAKKKLYKIAGDIN